MMTKVDILLDDVLKGHMECIFDSGVVDSTIKMFCELSRIPRASVLPVINYQEPYEKPNYVMEILVKYFFYHLCSFLLSYLYIYFNVNNLL
jgi:hypothetical protein